jgi:hypothetical protein
MLRRSLLGVLVFSALTVASSAGAIAAPASAAALPSDGGLPALADTGRATDQLIVDPCEFRNQCDPLPSGVLPPGLGLHPTVIHANIFNYFPDGPLTCMRSPYAGPERCTGFTGSLPRSVPGMNSEMGSGSGTGGAATGGAGTGGAGTGAGR